MLTARIGALLEQIGQMEQREAQHRAERQALARALNAMEREATERNATQQHATGKELTTMPTLGEIVNYQPKIDVGTEPLAALVIAVHEDGTADLRIAGGYCLGWTDAQNVAASDDGAAGTFFTPGSTQPASRRKANGSS